MEITDFTKGKLWAIKPSYLEEMLVKVPELKTAGDMAVRFTENPEERDDFMLRNGVAIIPITGPISKRGSFWSFFYGGTPLSVLNEVFMEALADSDVQAIVLDIDSPGGTVSGTEAFGDLIYNSRGQKPIVAFGNGMMASAAYWIGSGADKIIVEQTTGVGSIGVVMVHWDFSEMDKMYGVKRTVLSAGKYKALGNSTEPLSDKARKIFENELDYIYTIFVDTVARNLGVDAETVLEDMADGRIFIGRQAVDVGLAHDIGSMDTAIETALGMIESPGFKINFLSAGATSPGKAGAMDIKTAEELSAAFPDLVEQVRKQGAESVDLDQVGTEAAQAEQNRILGLVNIQFGQEAGEIFKAVVDSGVTVEQFTAVKAANPNIGEVESPELKAIQDSKDEMLTAIKEAGAENPGSGGEENLETDFMALVDAYQREHKCSKTEAMKKIGASHPDAHKAYLEKLKPIGTA